MNKCNRGEEDAKKDNMEENESFDSQQGMSESPVERKHQGIEEELQSSELQEEALAIPEYELVSCDQKPQVASYNNDNKCDEDAKEDLK
ncbi:hypothetical protein TSUD_383180 [Trifolium subterraneum]|nr:hypothetical protein TSUD_383180 [Trifolium subterraneum]